MENKGAQGNLWDDLNICYLDYGNSYTCVYIPKFIILYTLSMCSLLYFNYTSTIVFLVDCTPPDSKRVELRVFEPEGGPAFFLLVEESTCNMNKKVVKILFCLFISQEAIKAK